MIARLAASIGFACLLVSIGTESRAEGLVITELRIPATFRGLFGQRTLSLEALVVRPDDSDAHPLVVLNHGSPRDAGARRGMTAAQLQPQAVEFARRGWTAVVVMRRGYGNSEGGWEEDYGQCDRPQYESAGREAAQDIRQAITYLARQPNVDARKILSVGISAGGFATVALTIDPPPGVVAAINFAGGRGSTAPDQVCGEGALVEAFRRYGKDSRVPMLWVYADNDHFFGPALARRFHEAFTGAGGRATLIAAPAFGADGHNLFSLRGIPLWTPYVDRFLADRELVVRTTLISLPARPDVAPPPGVSKSATEAFNEFVASPGHKAFAISNDGYFGWRAARRTAEDARNEALTRCRNAGGRSCRVYMLDDGLAK